MSAAIADAVLHMSIPVTLKQPANLLYHMGLLQSPSLKMFILQAAYSTISLSLIVIEVIQFGNVSHVSEFVINLEAVFSEIQILGKMLVLLYHRENLTKLLANAVRFWSGAIISEEAELEQDYIRSWTVKLEKIFYYALIGTGAITFVYAYFTNTPVLGLWTFEGYMQYFSLFQIGQIIYSIFGIIFMSASVCFYLSYCIEISMQFKLISYYLRKYGESRDDKIESEKECYKKIKLLIQHHQYIIEVFKRFQHVFSFILLLEYVTDVPLILAELFAVQESTNKGKQLRHVLLGYSLTAQLAFYCIPANYMSHEAKEVGIAVYFSSWEERLFPSLKTTLALFMQNAQKGIEIKAGGLITINADTLVNVLKVAWSASSIMKGLK